VSNRRVDSPKSRIVDPPAGRRRLHLVASASELRIRRLRRAKGFVYVDRRGVSISDETTLNRVRQLGIPPAYEDVRIAADPAGHIQAVGRDAAGRLQYLYHPEWAAIRERRKSAQLAALCRVLPRIRRQLRRRLQQPGLDRDKVTAALLYLLDGTHIRIGCEDYVHTGRSRGAATLLKRNVRCSGQEIALSFRGKGGRQIECQLSLPALIPVIEQLRRLAGGRLFQYRDADGHVRRLTAHDANEFLRHLAGASVTAKDYRTLAATAAAAAMLHRMGRPRSAREHRRQAAAVMREVSQMLANTPAVTRKSYVHPRVLEAHASGELATLFGAKRRTRYLSRAEAVVAALFAEDRPAERGVAAAHGLQAGVRWPG
jgi:DNA topoisomerase-1